MDTKTKVNDLSRILKTGWAKHPDQPLEVAETLKKIDPLEIDSRDLAAYIKLLIHVYGGHLNQFSDALRVLENIQSKRQSKEYALSVGLALVHTCLFQEELARFFIEEASQLEFPQSTRVQVYAWAVSEMLHSRPSTDEALGLFMAAVDLSDLVQGGKDPAARSLAVAGNNVACKLDEKTQLSPEELKLMQQGAHTARKFWELAGTWLETERAEYRLCMSYLKAQETTKALFHARECERICLENNADSFEWFFVNEALTKVYRAKCLQTRSLVREDLQILCNIP